MLDYKSEEYIQRQKNINELRFLIQENKLRKSDKNKIKKFSERFGLEYELINHKLMIDDLFVFAFIKDPIKQSFHQGLAANYISKIKGVVNFRQLNSKDSGSLYVINGMVVDHEQFNNSSVSVKSIDFEWDYINGNGELIRCYASHKYTNEAGGAQDNQYKDLQSFMDNAKSHRNKMYFYGIADGDYYLANNKDGINKIQLMNRNFIGNRCYALTINELDMHMRNNL